MNDFVALTEKCPNCGKPTYVCMTHYLHSDIELRNGVFLLTRDKGGDHDDGDTRLNCTECDFQSETEIPWEKVVWHE
jgi:ribosomal protein S27AE